MDETFIMYNQFSNGVNKIEDRGKDDNAKSSTACFILFYWLCKISLTSFTFPLFFFIDEEDLSLKAMFWKYLFGPV